MKRLLDLLKLISCFLACVFRVHTDQQYFPLSHFWQSPGLYSLHVLSEPGYKNSICASYWCISPYNCPIEGVSVKSNWYMGHWQHGIRSVSPSHVLLDYKNSITCSLQCNIRRATVEWLWVECLLTWGSHLPAQLENSLPPPPISHSFKQWPCHCPFFDYPLQTTTLYRL